MNKFKDISIFQNLIQFESDIGQIRICGVKVYLEDKNQYIYEGSLSPNLKNKSKSFLMKAAYDLIRII